MSTEVHQAVGPVVWTSAADVAFLKGEAALSSRGRSRICAHPTGDDAAHEMIVVLRRDQDIRPHLHPGKTESFHVIEGLVTVVFFRDDGTLEEVVRMGDFHSGLPFFVRQTKPLFHTQLAESDFVVFHEVIPGPFTGDAVMAPWAPHEPAALRAYLKRLRDLLRDRGSCRGSSE